MMGIENNKINKERRFLMFNLSIFDCLTKEERKIYNDYKSTKDPDEQNSKKDELIQKVKSFSSIREIDKKVLFDVKSEEARVIS